MRAGRSLPDYEKAPLCRWDRNLLKPQAPSVVLHYAPRAGTLNVLGTPFPKSLIYNISLMAGQTCVYRFCGAWLRRMSGGFARQT